MDKTELITLGPERLADLVLEFGHIVRKLDEDCEYLEYWTQDGEYINDLAVSQKNRVVDSTKAAGEFVDCTDEKPCCDRRNEYNGFASGPLKFVCPKHCSCHD